MSSDVRVRVVIPNYNGAHFLPDCLRSLHAEHDVSPEIVVVDNGSIDESEAATRRWGADWLPLGANRGLALACNEGARGAEAEFLFFANCDMRFEPECLAALVEVLGWAGDEAFSADPLQFNWAGDRVIHFRTVLRQARSLRERLADGIFQAPPLVRSYAPAREICEIPWGCAGALLVRRRLFEAIGGFDPSFFIDFEDVDLCLRAALRGWSHWFVPQSRLYHHWGASNDTELRKARPDLARRLPRKDRARIASQARNHAAFALKLLEPDHACRVVLARMAAAASYTARGRPATGASIARGVARALAGWPKIRRQRAEAHAGMKVTPRDFLARFAGWSAPDALIWPASESGLRLPDCGLEAKR